MESNVEYETSKIKEWFDSHYLTPEQLAQLIAEKVERAENHLLVHRHVVKQFACD